MVVPTSQSIDFFHQFPLYDRKRVLDIKEYPYWYKAVKAYCNSSGFVLLMKWSPLSTNQKQSKANLVHLNFLFLHSTDTHSIAEFHHIKFHLLPGQTMGKVLGLSRLRKQYQVTLRLQCRYWKQLCPQDSVGQPLFQVLAMQRVSVDLAEVYLGNQTELCWPMPQELFPKKKLKPLHKL